MEDKILMCAIDASTNRTGISLFVDGVYTEHTLIDLRYEKDSNTRINLMVNALMKQLQIWSPDIVYIEDDWSAVNVQTTKMLSEIIGSVRTWCILNNSEFNKILPSVWRKLCGIDIAKKKRAELKQEAIDYVKRNFGIDVGDDVADSICIGMSAVLSYQNVE